MYGILYEVDEGLNQSEIEISTKTAYSVDSLNKQTCCTWGFNPFDEPRVVHSKSGQKIGSINEVTRTFDHNV